MSWFKAASCFIRKKYSFRFRIAKHSIHSCKVLSTDSFYEIRSEMFCLVYMAITSNGLPKLKESTCSIRTACDTFWVSNSTKKKPPVSMSSNSNCSSLFIVFGKQYKGLSKVLLENDLFRKKKRSKCTSCKKIFV